MEKKSIGIIGSGGQADETESFLESSHQVAFRALDKEYIKSEDPRHIDIESPLEEHRRLPVTVAIGAPALRKAMLERWPGETYKTVVSEHAIVDKTAELGDGCIIASRAVITTNVKLGAHTIVNIGATISHDSKIGDFVTISPGVNIGGRAELGDGVFVGIGATIIDGIRIADGSVVGAGANVLKDITEENSVVVGNPARLIRQNEGWLREI